MTLNTKPGSAEEKTAAAPADTPGSPTPHSRLLTQDSSLKTPHSRLLTPDPSLQTPHSRLLTQDSSPKAVHAVVAPAGDAAGAVAGEQPAAAPRRPHARVPGEAAEALALAARGRALGGGVPPGPFVGEGGPRRAAPFPGAAVTSKRPARP
eukprot:gene242-biopygen5620